MSKSYQRKKNWRRALRKMCKEGFINDAKGKMIPRNQAADNSMKRDYSPQR